METSTPAPQKANPTSREGPASISVSPICTAATDVKSYPQRERKPKRLGDDYEDGINMNREHKKLGSASKKRKKTSPESANTDETVAKSKSLEDSFCNSISHLKSGSESVSSFQPSNLEALKYVDKDKTKDLSEFLIIDSSDDSEYTFENREQYLELKKEVERVRTTKRLALEVKQGVGSKNKSCNNDRTNGAHSHVGIAESGIGTTRETKLLACEDIAQSENQQLDTSISTDLSRRKGRRSVKSVNYAELDKGLDLSEMDKSKENQTVNTSKKKSRGGRQSKKDLLLTQLKDKYEDVSLGNVEDNDTKFNESSKKELDNENEKVIEMPKKRVRKSDCKDLSVSDVLSDDSNVTIETSLDAESFLSKTVQEKGLIEEPVQKKKRRRKPKRQEQHEESINEGESLLNNTTNGIQEAFEKTDKPMQERKRRRKPKNQESLEASINEGELFLNNTMNGIQEELEKTDEPLPKRKRGKKPKKDAVVPEVNACLNQPLSADGTAGVAGEVVSKRGRKRKAVDYSSLADEGPEVM
ncbi:hypothetical protein DPMN_143769 [Dreissena polymorpha]|uniref:Uncharacterized protein n=1 Tax=Dreissena polymorpha TaxID=45954 RepID=A0A9D4GE65_DREPO|nr:hypothetical protein DPMN_143769 [Dreissena polymorpha]